MRKGLNTILKKSQKENGIFVFKKRDIVQVLPRKKVGEVTDIVEGFVILDNERGRPYMPIQLKLLRRQVGDFYPIDKGTKFVSGTQLYEVEFDNKVSIKLNNYLDHMVILISKDKDIKGNCTIYKYQELSNGKTVDYGISYYDSVMMKQIVEIIYGGKENA